MGFRRKSQEEKAWHDWLAAHRDELARCGVADWVLSDRCRWLRFLGEGYDIETGWSPALLPPDNQVLLYTLIEREYDLNGYLGLLLEMNTAKAQGRMVKKSRN